MSRGISDTTPIPEETPQDQGPTNKDILDYLDDLSSFVRELDVRLTTIERFAIKEINPEQEAQSKQKPKNFLTGK